MVTCGPVVAELLAGVRRPDRPRLWSLLRALPWARPEPERWREVGELAALLRDAGQRVPLTDVESAVAALEAQAVLWTWDPDFSRIAEVSDLRVGSP